MWTQSTVQCTGSLKGTEGFLCGSKGTVNCTLKGTGGQSPGYCTMEQGSSRGLEVLCAGKSTVQ